MSKEVYTRCDMCGQLVIEGSGNEVNMGRFCRDSWDSDELDLCNVCATMVQKFISGGWKEKKDEAGKKD